MAPEHNEPGRTGYRQSAGMVTVAMVMVLLPRQRKAGAGGASRYLEPLVPEVQKLACLSVRQDCAQPPPLSGTRVCWERRGVAVLDTV